MTSEANRASSGGSRASFSVSRKKKKPSNVGHTGEGGEDTSVRDCVGGRGAFINGLGGG